MRAPGPHYPIPGYPAGPPPVHRIEIWVGAMHPRTLELIGRSADGWVPGGGTGRIADFPMLADRIDAAAAAAGRDPAAIRRVVNLTGVITDGATSDQPLEGPVEQWVETLVSWVLDLRMDAFVFWPPDPGTRQVERFAAEVAPAVREHVARERAP